MRNFSFSRVAITLIISFSLMSRAHATIHVITVQNHFFSPSSVTVNLGDTMKWQWVNGSHTTTSLTIPAGAATWNHNINSSSSSFMYIPTVLGTYNYKCTPHFSMGMVASFVVVCPAVSPTISANGNTTFCSGQSVALHISSNSAGLTFQWKNGSNTISGATSSSFTATAAGSYTLVATNSCGSFGTSNSIVVTVNTAPTANDASISATGSTGICAGNNVTLNCAGAGFSYSWKRDGSPILGATGQSYSASLAGAYTCNVSNNCGALLSNSITVTVTNPPASADALVSAAGPVQFCSPGSVLLTVSSTTFSYQWKKNNNNIPGATNNTLTATATASYTCAVSNTCGTVTSNATQITAVTTAATITPAGTVTMCAGQDTVLQANTGANLTYLWKRNGVAITGATNATLTVAAAGNYKVTVTKTTTGCSKNSPTTSVMITCRLSGNETAGVFPNPSAANFNLDLAAYGSDAVNATLIDITGRQLMNWKTNSEISFGEDLAPGIYFLRIESATTPAQVIKLTKTE